MYYKNGITYGSQQAIRNDNKDTSLPMFMTDELIESLGYLKIVDGIKPIPSAVQYVTEGTIGLVSGVPLQAYILMDMFADTAEYITTEGAIVAARTKAEHETDYLAKLQADTISVMVQHFTDVTTQYIESKVQAYNTSEALTVGSVNSISNVPCVA